MLSSFKICLENNKKWHLCYSDFMVYLKYTCQILDTSTSVGQMEIFWKKTTEFFHTLTECDNRTCLHAAYEFLNHSKIDDITH